MFLTIAIPTYQRGMKAYEQVCRLQSMVKGKDVEVVVVNNACPETVKIFKNFSDLDNQIRVFHNPCNIGMMANFCRCVEYGRGEWIWIVGDDDPINANALEVIFRELKQTKDLTVFIKFGGCNIKPPVLGRKVFDSLDEFAVWMDSAWKFSAILFISNSIFRRSVFVKYMACAYNWTYSAASHLTVIFSALRDGYTAEIVPEEIVKHMPAPKGEGWSTWRLIMGVSILGEIEGCEVLSRKSLPRIYRDWLGELWWFVVPIIPIKSLNKPKSYWLAYYLRCASVTEGFVKWYYVFCALFVLPIVSSRFMRLLLPRDFCRRNDNQGIERL